MKNQYVILTGGKNNAGDHLIKYRAHQLFKSFRSDRKIIDLNGWEKLSDTDLVEINNSKALIMVGGPALLNKMYPKVYALRENLDEIEVPMLTMGIGWYSKKGNWENTHDYKLSNDSVKLLEKINSSGYLSSVRDYHTLNTLFSKGMRNFLMTGCPALYDKQFLNSKIDESKTINKIAFSLGVSLRISKKMYQQMQNVLLLIHELFPSTHIDVVFHHSPSKEYINTHGSNRALYNAQNSFLIWLKENNFHYVDISGSAEKLINYYSNVDLHIGYRVHAHIFMNSISKLSILLNEDGRGKGLEKVLGGMIFDAYDEVNDTSIFKVLHRLSINIDSYKENPYLIKDLKNTINYELNNGIKFMQSRLAIDSHFSVMNNFLKQLP